MIFAFILVKLLLFILSVHKWDKNSLIYPGILNKLDRMPGYETRVNGDAGTMGDSVGHSAKLFASGLTWFYLLYILREGRDHSKGCCTSQLFCW